MAPSLARKVLIYAAVDGLVLQPLGQRGQRPVSATKITYKDNNIGPALKHGGEGEEPGKSFEAFGVVGKHEESSLALGSALCATVGIVAKAMVYRTTCGFKDLFSNNYNQTRASSADTKQACLRCHRSRPDPAGVSLRSRSLDHKYPSYDPTKSSWRAWSG